MKKHIWIIVLFLAAACTTDRKPQGEVREPDVCIENWDHFEDKFDYYKELIDLQDSAIAGQEISIQHLQALMPQNEIDFHVFMATERCAFIEVDGEKQASPKALYLIAGEMAVADTLDMMEHYLKWFDWCDGWVAETVGDKAIRIEKCHPDKFHRLMQSSEHYEAWKEFRDEILEYEKALEE